MTHAGHQLDVPLDLPSRYPDKLIDEFPWETEPQRSPGIRGTSNTRQI